jgi:6-pyruvoyltetrahydropterin/6-carboxytetrahydropterin synthase
MFDHTLVIAHDDPHLEKFQALALLGLNDVGGVCDIRIVEAVGCEKFSEIAFMKMKDILETFQRGESYTIDNGQTFECRYPVGAGVKLRSVEVFEHNANSAVYEG